VLDMGIVHAVILLRGRDGPDAAWDKPSKCGADFRPAFSRASKPADGTLYFVKYATIAARRRRSERHGCRLGANGDVGTPR
jgi:hypothetical protein